MRERIREKVRGLYISMPGLVTGGFLEQIASTGQQMPERPYDLPTKRIEVNGAELHYFEFGEGEPVVFVHGSISDYRTWGNQFEAFSADYRVISYSRRYHYPNPWNGDSLDYSTGLHAKDLAEFIRGLELGPVHVIGQSTGATIAAYCASHHPELIRTLTVNELDHAPWLSEIRGGEAVLEDYLANVDRPAAKLLAMGDEENAIRWLVDGIQGKGTYESLTLEMRAVIFDNIAELKVEFRCANIFYSPFSFEDARRIDAPTLLLEGGASLPLFGLIAEKFAECVPSIKRVTVEDAPHAIHVIAPEQFSAVVLDFLDRNRGESEQARLHRTNL